MTAAQKAKSTRNLIAWVGVVLVVVAVILVPISLILSTSYSDWWGEPWDETVTVTKYWPQTGNNSIEFGNLPITHSTAVRIKPAALGRETDRLYVAAGSRLYALEPTNGFAVWGGNGYIDFAHQGDPNPTISVDPVVVNFGSMNSETGNNFWVYAATASGNVYAMNDTNPALFIPTVVKVGTMDGLATGLVVYSGNDYASWSPYDMVAASSSKGTVYAWQVNGTGHHGPQIIHLGTKPIHMAGQPMRGVGPYPLFSPAFYYTSTNRTRPYLYVGSEDGNLTAIDISNLSDLRVEWRTRVLTAATSWTSAPVVQEVVGAQVNAAVVFAATDDSSLWALDANNGTQLPQGGGPVRIGRSPDRLDRGRFTQPLLDQDSYNLYVGSSSGYAYSVAYAASDSWTGPVHVNWFFRDFFHSEGSTYIASPPFEFGGIIVFVASNYDRGQPGPSPEDQGTLFALNIVDGTRSWYRSFESPILVSAVGAASSTTGFEEVMFGTDAGSVYAFSVHGMIGYGPSITCPDGNQISRGSQCTKQSIPVLLLTPALLTVGVIMIAYGVLKGRRIGRARGQHPQ